MKLNVQPDPDFSRLRKVFLRQGEPDRVPFIEVYINVPVMEVILDKKFPALALFEADPDRELAQKWWDLRIEFMYRLGFDYVPVTFDCPWPMRRELRLVAQDTAELSMGERSWANESAGVINSWQDFEDYAWPKVEDLDFSSIEYVAQNLPEGMKVIGYGGGWAMEGLMGLMGLTPLSYALMDTPDLVAAVSDKLDELAVAGFGAMAEMDGVGALWLGDDMGFKTATLMSPTDLRRYVFPGQKNLVDIAHAHDLPFCLHACGNLEQVMDDLIDDVGIDAKHSYEDVFLPVTEAKRRYGDRIAILGGVDVDVLSRSSEQEVREYTRRVLRECGPGGGYALGSGNSWPGYIKTENYLAMMDEGWKHGRYPITL
jgi:uroporphyrinogen decarboxylase